MSLILHRHGVVASMAGGGTLWTPDQRGDLLYWLDAADADTVTIDGSGVASWESKASNGWTATRASGSPQRSTTINGLDVITVDNAGFNITWSTATNYFGWYCVLKTPNTAGHNDWWTSPFIMGREITGYTTDFQFGLNYGKFAFAAKRDRIVTATSVNDDTARLLSCRRTTSNATWVGANGVEETYGAMGDTTNFSAQNYCGIGYRPGSTYYCHGEIAEIVMISTFPSAADQDVIEGYLSHKWGIAGNLPVDHPYKSAPPTV